MTQDAFLGLLEPLVARKTRFLYDENENRIREIIKGILVESQILGSPINASELTQHVHILTLKWATTEVFSELIYEFDLPHEICDNGECGILYYEISDEVHHLMNRYVLSRCQ